MPQASQERNYLSLRKGLNTVSNEITFPDEFTSDELNYTIEPDGSRKRRRGCRRESGGSVKTIQTGGTYFGANDWCSSFKWPNAGGDPSNMLMVHQIGDTLWFTNDAETVSTTFDTQVVDLSNRKIADATTAALIAGEPCSFAGYRGFLIVTHKYLNPFYLSYTYPDDAWVIGTHDITILIRDFEGIDDGVSIDHQPVVSTITEDHRYNLRNRGWNEADITAYRIGGTFPAKNQRPWMGYTRAAVDTGFEPATGLRAFSMAKLKAEIFSNMSAPQGSILINPLDTTQSFTSIGEGPSVELHSDPDEMFASGDGNDSTFRLRLQAPLFKTSRTSGYTSGTTTMDVTGFEWTYTTTLGPDGIAPWYDINGEWIIYSATDSDGGASNDPGTPHAVSDLAVGRVFLTLNDAAVGAGGGGGGTTSTEFDSLTFHCVQVDPSWD